MHSADTGTGEHRNDGLRNHGQVDDDAVTLGHTLVNQHTGKSLYFVKKFGVGKAILDPGHCGVVDNCSLVAATSEDVTVYGVEACVEFSTREPAVYRGTR